MAMVLNRDVASSEPGRRRVRISLPYLMAAAVVLVVATAPPTRAVCPAVDEHCYCRTEFGMFKQLYCENLGNVSNVPAFRESANFYDKLLIRTGTVILTIQANAFKGIHTEKVILQVCT